MYNKYKLPSSVNIIHCTSLDFHSWCPESTVPTDSCPESTRPMDSCFQGTSCQNLMMYVGSYQHIWVVS